VFDVERGMKKSQFTTNISLYLENGRSYNRRQIGTRMRSIERCHFQWSWTTHNLDVKDMSSFYAEYLRNGTRNDRE